MGKDKAKGRRNPSNISLLVGAKLIFLEEGGMEIICFNCIKYTPTVMYISIGVPHLLVSLRRYKKKETER